MRVFIGIRIKPDERIKKILLRLKKEEGIKVVEEENTHINLKFLGEISEKQAVEIENVLKEIKTKPFNVTLRSIGFFPNEEFIRVIFIKVESKELMRINKFIEDRLYEKGFMRERKKFAPHLTLARVKKKMSKRLINELKEEELNSIFKIKEINLIKSTLTKEKPVYKTIYKVVL